MTHPFSSIQPSKLLGLCLASAFGLGATSVQAEGMLDKWSVYVGYAHINIDAKMPPIATTPPTLPAGIDARLRVGNADTVGFGLAYRFSPQWEGEFALGVPPEHKVYGADFIEPFGQVSRVTQVAPTVFANYLFGDLFSGLHVFVGPGINYTRFINAHSTPSGDAVNGGPTEIKLSPSWGLAGHIGASWQFDKNWSVVATMAKADVKSDLTTTTTGVNEGDGPITVIGRTRITFNPTVYTLSVGYAF
jgi:outer membrane protein